MSSRFLDTRRKTKRHICRRYLIPKQLEGHGISEDNVIIDDEALDIIIRSHTREAGVRNLDRRIADICRGVAVQVAEAMSAKEHDEEAEEVKITITKDNLDTFLGPEKYQFEVAQRTSQPGVATGLAWTAAGGDILFIEATKMPREGRARSDRSAWRCDERVGSRRTFVHPNQC